MEEYLVSGGEVLLYIINIETVIIIIRRIILVNGPPVLIWVNICLNESKMLELVYPMEIIE
jgi:hypothetical protein